MFLQRFYWQRLPTETPNREAQQRLPAELTQLKRFLFSCLHILAQTARHPSERAQPRQWRQQQRLMTAQMPNAPAPPPTSTRPRRVRCQMTCGQRLRRVWQLLAPSNITGDLIGRGQGQCNRAPCHQKIWCTRKSKRSVLEAHSVYITAAQIPNAPSRFGTTVGKRTKSK